MKNINMTTAAHTHNFDAMPVPVDFTMDTAVFVKNTHNLIK